MGDTPRKYPESVQSIYIAGVGGKEGRKLEVDTEESLGQEMVSKAHRVWDREVRAMSLAGAKFFETYGQLHEASNEQTKDGAMKHFGKNAIKAHKSALKVLRGHSKMFDFDPTEVHDNIIERLEDLEEELKEDDED
jgi:hypothetical protein